MILEWFYIPPPDHMCVCVLCCMSAVFDPVVRNEPYYKSPEAVCSVPAWVYTHVRVHDCLHKFVCTLSCIYSVCMFLSLTSHAWFQQMELVSYSWPKQLWIINKLCRKPHTNSCSSFSLSSLFLRLSITHMQMTCTFTSLDDFLKPPAELMFHLFTLGRCKKIKQKKIKYWTL